MVTLQEFVEKYVNLAWQEKKRTDNKYGSKEQGPDNKARLVACVIENFWAMLDAMRAGNAEKSKEHYAKTLAHMISMAAHLEQVKTGAQYIPQSQMPSCGKP